MANTAEAKDPSMEDILNTIRGVISGEDDGIPGVGEAASTPAGAQAPAKDGQPKADEAEVKKEDVAVAAEAQTQPQSKDVASAPQAGEEDDDILELTDIIEEDGETMSDAPTNTASEEGNSEGLLDDIDNMLGGDAEATAPAEQAATTEDTAQEPAAEAAPVAEDTTAAPAPTTEAASSEEASTAEAAAPAAEAEPASDVPPASPEAAAPAAEQAPVAEVAEGERLVSQTAAATSQAALKEMMTAIPRQKVVSPATRGGTTLEDLVIEAIRPFLTEWMDKNLATIVKQLVEKEIKHLIPRDVE